jgi:hypothetical protein
LAANKDPTDLINTKDKLTEVSLYLIANSNQSDGETQLITRSVAKDHKKSRLHWFSLWHELANLPIIDHIHASIEGKSGAESPKLRMAICLLGRT